MKTEPGNRQFFITPSHPCSYLSGREAATLFVDPRETITEELYQTLTEQGFRRSGGHLYRPHCRACQACVPTRIPVAHFQAKRRQRRTGKRNADLTLRVESGEYQAHYYDLYARYIAARHSDGDMFPPSPEQFRSFLLSQWSETLFLCAYENDQLMSVAVTDRQESSLSAIYTFFEPEAAERSLGVFSILAQIALCRELGLPHLYLGYWIRDAEKMRYKVDYRPIELFVGGRWVLLT